MTAKESLLSTSKQGQKKDQGATPEEALEAINSYYENISDDQFAEDVRGACAEYEEGSIESPPIRTEEETSGRRSSVKRSL